MKKKISVLFLIYSLIMCTLVGCETPSISAEEQSMVSTICEDADEIVISDEAIIEEDLSGIVPLSKRRLIKKKEFIKYISDNVEI